MAPVGAALASCALTHVDLRDNGAVIRFSVELADDPEERAQGLMHREELPRFSGMLFVFEKPGPVAFWMKNTLIPLDMIFLDQSGTVKRIHENAIPGDLTAIPGGNDIFAVLEVNGGLSATLGLKEGAQMRHPAFAGPLAAWPCTD